MKKLVCAKDIEALGARGETVCYVDGDTIVTPSARDAAEERGIVFSEQMPVSGAAGAAAPGVQEIDAGQVYQVLKALMERGLLEDIFKPFESERHGNGLKVVRGGSVKMDVFETGTPGAKAFFQEVVNKEESHISAGFLVIDHSEFPWELTYEEIDYVIVNGAECEPYLTSDYRVMLEQPEKVVGGLKVILQLFDKAKGVIGIEENKPEAIRILSELVKDEPRIEVCTLKTKYPQGGERFLIYAVTGGREINSTMLPADAGCIVDNIDTVVSIYNAVCETTPLIRRIITVTGDAIREPRNFEVRLGTNYQELIEAAGGFKEEPEKVLSGGPMMGQALFSYDIPVMKTSSALTCLTKDQVAANAETACIRCGRCVDVCPGRVVPQMLMTAAEHHDLAAFEKLNGMECCECGSCTFICPAHRPLTQAFKEMRKAVMAERKKKA